MSILYEVVDTLAFVLISGIVAFLIGVHVIGWQVHEAAWCLAWSPFGAWVRVAIKA